MTSEVKGYYGKIILTLTTMGFKHLRRWCMESLFNNNRKGKTVPVLHQIGDKPVYILESKAVFVILQHQHGTLLVVCNSWIPTYNST